ncbi:MAG: tetratricopeptide repeat protein [Patescibacteria group bacterium]|nr:tetratricopeptide repeat protein [Patescibacteria group bacterium]MDE1944436.1 tetratricopeptide repeat protein [Patescibacteria group bacterium]MDE1945275.1 tetratricopeptide repeat protein [Patescibacteria group bacterium]MDE2057905.1 tetratricopeptide repeat protein [Patescibacteria group bacterium]
MCATIIIAAVLIIPAVAFPTLPTKSFLLAAGVLVTLAVWILARLSRGNIIFPPALLLAALWLPALAYLLSAVFAGGSFANATWGTALDEDTLGFIAMLAALGTLAALVVRRNDHYQAFLRVFALAAGALVALSALLLLLGEIAPSLVSPSLTLLGSGKDLAVVLGLIVISVLLALRFLALTARARQYLFATGGAALVLAVVFNIQLVLILVALVALGLFVEAIMARRPGSFAEGDLDEVASVTESAVAEAPEHGRSFLAPLVVLVVALFFIIGGNLGSALAGALHTGGLDVRPSWQATLGVGRQVWSASPIFGSGPDTFGAAWLKGRGASLNATPFWNVNFTSGIGFIPTSAVTTGLAGALAWLALIALFLVYGIRTLVARAPEDPTVQYVAIASFVGGAYLLTFAFLNLPGPVVLGLAFLALGLFASAARYARGARQWGVVFARAPRLGFVVVFALTLLLLGSVGVAYALVERSLAVSELARGNAAYAAGNLDAAANDAAAAISFAPLADAYTLQALVANAKLAAIVSSSSPAANAQQLFQSTISAGIAAALAATKASPADYQAWIALGNLYAEAVPLGVSGAYASAKDAYQKAIALSPTDPQLYYALAQLDLANKDLKSAETDLKQAITLKNDYTNAIVLLTQVLVADGNVKDALSAAQAAAYFTPNDPNVLFELGVLEAASGDLANAAAALNAAVTAEPTFANARYFLAAVLAEGKQYAEAKAQLEAIAGLSADNAAAVASAMAALDKNQNPFPANLLKLSSPTGAPAAGNAATSTAVAP